MRVALIEDEPPALEHLERLLARVAPDAQVVARLRTVRETRAFLAGGEIVDLLVADIQLGDGLSLEALAERPVTAPIIFATAFDEHVMAALATNGIAFLLKPITEADLAAALAKRTRLAQHFLGALDLRSRPGTRLVGRRGRDWVGVAIGDVAWIRVRHGITTATTTEGVALMLEQPLQAVADRLHPARFFRVNRWYLVRIDAIERVRPAGKGRLDLVLTPASDEPVTVTQEQAGAFRAWFGLPG